LSAANRDRNVEGEFVFVVYPGQEARLQVADAGWNIEKFEVFNGYNYTGWTTSEPLSEGRYWTSSYDASSSTSNWSSGNWALAPGSYRLVFRLARWSTVKTDVIGSNTYFGAFKVTVVQTPDLDGDKIADQFETGTGIYVSPVDTGTNPSKADTDGDGLNDWDEIHIHGTDPNRADTDGDGFLDLTEINAGKSPTNASETPDALIEARTAIEITFYTHVGTLYRIEWSTDLTTWTPFSEIITGDGNAITRFYSTREYPKRFFRAAKIPEN